MKVILLQCALMTTVCAIFGNAESVERKPADAIRVTGRLLAVNGVTEVPAGLFGVHATPLNEERIREWGIDSVRLIDHSPRGNPIVPGQHRRVPAGINMVVECFWDRYQPALMLSNPGGWQAQLLELARTYGSNALHTGIEHHVEFWNEPYLNWGTRPGVNYDPRHYDISEAAEGAPMRIRGQSEPLEHLVWSRQVRTVEAQSGNMTMNSYLAHSNVGHRRPAGEEFEFRGRRYRNEEMWWGHDPTQKHYWAGEQNSLFYRKMLNVFAKELKRVNPAVQIVAGWDFHIQSNNWDAWRMLYKPMIDDAIEWIDGISEHHYGGDTRMVAGAYETVYAYAKGKYGKALKFYNTEAGGMLDPEQPGNPRTRAEGDPLTKARGGMTYTLRDILHLIDLMPDKAVARAAHDALSWSGGGDEFAFRLLRDLRGRLLETVSPDADLWVVSALNNDGQLNAVIFNDSEEMRNYPVAITPPRGLVLSAGRLVSVGVENGALAMQEAGLEIESGADWAGTVTVGGKSAVSLVFDLSGELNEPDGIEHQQFVSDQIISWLNPGDSLELEIKIPGESLANADAAYLQLVYGWSAGDAVLEVNGTAVERGPSMSWINRQAIDLSLLQETNSIVLRCNEAAGGGFHVNAASIVLAVR